MRNKAIAIVVGTLLTLLLWALAYAALNAIFEGDFPWPRIGWLLIGLAAFLCPLIGGYVAARVSQANSLRLGALSGTSAGLVVLLVGALASGLAPNTTLAGIGLVLVGAIGGGIGTLLPPGQRA